MVRIGELSCLSSFSSATTWALHALSIHRDVQRTLRAELLSLDTDTPTLEQLDALPYLEHFVRETLRLYAPVAHVTRMAAADDVLPLSTPAVDPAGRAYTSLPYAPHPIQSIDK